MSFKVNKVKKVKTYKVTFYSRYYGMDVRIKKVEGTSKSDIRNRWHEIMNTDEFVIRSIEEIK